MQSEFCYLTLYRRIIGICVMRPANRIKIIASGIWRGINSDYLKALSERMPRRMAEEIDAKRQHKILVRLNLLALSFKNKIVLT